MQPVQLRVEQRDAPLGIDERAPRFSWWLEDDRDGARQTAYRIRVATSRELLATDTPDLWDSGRVESSDQANIAYAGSALTSRTRAHWDVSVWDGDGERGPTSAAAEFELGLLLPSDWTASWIATQIEEGGGTLPPAPILSRTVEITSPVKSARLYITALGLHSAEINGVAVGADWFRPGWTDYRKRVQYQTYDVTHLLESGRNVLAVTLGDGWYSGRIGWSERAVTYGKAPHLLAQLEVTTEDGKTVVGTDQSWTWREGPVRRQDLIEGEEYDARREVPLSELADGSGHPVSIVPPPAAVLVAQPDDGVVAVDELEPVSSPERVERDGSRVAFVYDLGQNFAGVVRLRVRGESGVALRLRYAEMLDDSGSLYTANLRSARAIDWYTLRGDNSGETWVPRFTFHGFRYVEVSYDARYKGAIDRFDRTTITGIPLSSAAEETGSFRCSNDDVNKLQENIRWGQLSNFIDVPTDCPQRDERLGWTGDAQVFAPTAAFNFNVLPFFTKWCRDLDDAQQPDGRQPNVAPAVLDDDDGGPGWSDARVLCAWAMYLAYGDERLLERHYEPMSKWIEWQASTARKGVRCHADCGHFPGYSDWLALDAEWGSRISATPRDLIGTAYFARSTAVMADIARIVGSPADVERFEGYHDEATTAFQREWLEDGPRLRVQTQTAHLMALAWDLLPEEARPAIVEQLVELLSDRDWHLSTGFLGTPLLCPVLSRFGRSDLAYRLLLTDTYPGWLFPVTNGATTMWERWNSWTPGEGFGDAGMNSFNHYAYGAIGEWLYSTVGGVAIDASRPGYEHVLIAPQPGDGIAWAETSIRSTRGLVRSRWDVDGNDFSLEVVLPANVSGVVSLPDGTRHEVTAGLHRFACATTR